MNLVARIYTIVEARRARKLGNAMFVSGTALAFTGIALGGLEVEPYLSLVLVVIGFIIVLLSYRFDIRGMLRLTVLNLSERLLELYVENRSRNMLIRVVKVFLRDYTGNVVLETDTNVNVLPRQSELIKLDLNFSEGQANIEDICIVVEGGVSVCVPAGRKVVEAVIE